MPENSSFHLDQGNIVYPKWKWKPGFKIGIGKSHTENKWNTFLQYTWFYNQENNLAAPGDFPPSQGLPAWPYTRILQVSGTDAIAHVTSSWNNQFNRIDWRFSMDCMAGFYFAFQPFFGLLGWFEKEWLQIHYGRPQEDLFLVNTKQTGGGIGLCIGTDTEFFFYKTRFHYWSLIGHFGVGFPWSYYHSFSSIFHENTRTFRERTRHMYTNVTPVIEMFVGFRLVSIWDDGYSMFFQFGWETQLWLDHIHAFPIYLQRQGVNANYSMEGFTGTIGIYF